MKTVAEFWVSLHGIGEVEAKLLLGLNKSPFNEDEWGSEVRLHVF